MWSNEEGREMMHTAITSSSTALARRLGLTALLLAALTVGQVGVLPAPVEAAAAGTVVVWGNNYSGQANVPSGLSGVIAIAAGFSHTVALKSDGTVVAWGDYTYGQTTAPSGLSGVTAIAAGECTHGGADERRHGRRLGPELLPGSRLCPPD